VEGALVFDGCADVDVFGWPDVSLGESRGFEEVGGVEAVDFFVDARDEGWVCEEFACAFDLLCEQERVDEWFCLE